MVVNTSGKIAMKCSKCGRYNMADLNAFKLKDTVNVFCSCGKKNLKAFIKNNEIVFEIDCPICENKHIYKFKLKDAFEKQMNILNCPETGIEIAFFGNGYYINTIVEKYREGIYELMKYYGISEDIVNSFAR